VHAGRNKEGNITLGRLEKEASARRKKLQQRERNQELIEKIIF